MTKVIGKTEIKRELKKLGFTLVGNYILKSEVKKFFVKAEKEKLSKWKNEIEKIIRYEKTVFILYDNDGNKLVANYGGMSGTYNFRDEIKVHEYPAGNVDGTEILRKFGVDFSYDAMPVAEWIKEAKEMLSKGLIKKIEQKVWSVQYSILFKDGSRLAFDLILGKDKIEIDCSGAGLADELAEAGNLGKLELKDEDLKKLMKTGRDENWEVPKISSRQKTFKGRF